MSELILNNIATPLPPSAGKALLYAKNDTLCVMGDDGIEYYLGRRETLTAARTYYVREDGDDGNDGLADTSGGAFLTIQKAIDVTASIDMSIYNVTIQIADGTYNSGRINLKAYIGSGQIYIQGNPVTPTNVKVVSSSIGFYLDFVSKYTIVGLQVTCAANSQCLYANGYGAMISFNNIDFPDAGASGYHIFATNGGMVRATGNYTISGRAYAHLVASFNGIIYVSAFTLTISGTPAFIVFAEANGLSRILSYSMTFTGSATGLRYYAGNNSVIETFGGGANYFPGNSAGVTATGGQYA